MSKKHNQRTRAEILAKREAPIVEVPVMKKILGPTGLPVFSLLIKKVRASKYTPHFGAKQAAKLARKIEQRTLKLAA